MFSHIMIGTNDLDRAKSFYDALLGTPGGVFSVSKPINGEPATAPNGGTIGFAANSPEQADAWHSTGVAHGATACEDPPGVREGALGKLYLAYLRDPDGNKLCALHRMS